MRAPTQLPGRAAGWPAALVTVLCLTAAVPAPADAGDPERVFVAKYRVQAFGLPLGEARLSVSLNGEAYAVEARARTTGIVRLFSDGSGDLNATGSLVEGVARPAVFSQRLKEGDKKFTVDMLFADNRVDDLVIDPKPRKRPPHKRVPVTDEHKRNVVDPVSGLLTAMAGRQEGAPCAGTVPIFTGESRFDLHLFDKGSGRYPGGAGSYDGPATICGVAYEPVAGHKPGGKDVKFNTENRDNEIWFARVDNIDLLVPVLWRLKFRDGRVDVVMTGIEVF